MLFINPASAEFGGFLSRYVPVGIPVGMGFIVAYLEKFGIACEILDEEIGVVTSDTIRKKLSNLPKPSIVGIGCLTAHVSRAYSIAKLIKKEIPDVTIIVGGLHPTALPDEPLDTGYIDYVVQVFLNINMKSNRIHFLKE